MCNAILRLLFSILSHVCRQGAARSHKYSFEKGSLILNDDKLIFEMIKKDQDFAISDRSQPRCAPACHTDRDISSPTEWCKANAAMLPSTDLHAAAMP